MNCYQHPETAAIAYCRSCGRPLCAVCQRLAEGTVFCPEHAPVVSGYAQTGQGAFDASNPYTQAAGTPPIHTGFRTSPALAFILGWIPGVGAIYNGQYLKGLVHAAIFGLLVSLGSNAGNAGGPFFGMMTAAFVFYMAFEAYHTAKKRQMGVPVTEWSSLAAPQARISGRTPAGPIVLIAVGVLFLLDTLHLIEFRDIARFWPVLLIVAGASMLYSRVTGLCAPRRPLPPPSGFTPDNTSIRETSSFMGDRT